MHTSWSGLRLTTMSSKWCWSSMHAQLPLLLHPNVIVSKYTGTSTKTIHTYEHQETGYNERRINISTRAFHSGTHLSQSYSKVVNVVLVFNASPIAFPPPAPILLHLRLLTHVSNKDASNKVLCEKNITRHLSLTSMSSMWYWSSMRLQSPFLLQPPSNSHPNYVFTHVSSKKTSYDDGRINGNKTSAFQKSPSCWL